MALFEGCSLVSRKSEGIIADLKLPLQELSMSSLADSVVSFRFELPEPYIWGIVTEVYFVDSTAFIVANVPLIDVVDGVYDGMFYSLLTPDYIDYRVSKSPDDYSIDFQQYDAESENPVVAFYEIIR